jgi:hypothetical protein
MPLREQVLGWLLGPEHLAEIRQVAGTFRVHASLEGNALWALLKLGLADERCDELARMLANWPWVDGGWNCDRKPKASHASFTESLIPLRGLALHARLTGSDRSRDAAQAAQEMFLSRRLFRRLSTGALVHSEFTRLHYPCYWHYDVLFGLKVMAEAGRIGDRRCDEALQLIESKRLAGGGFAAEKKYYRVGADTRLGSSLVDWGGAGARRMNEFVTVDALAVLQSAGRRDATSKPSARPTRRGHAGRKGR